MAASVTRLLVAAIIFVLFQHSEPKTIEFRHYREYRTAGPDYGGVHRLVLLVAVALVRVTGAGRTCEHRQTNRQRQ